jgi:hypothetical protein
MVHCMAAQAPVPAALSESALSEHPKQLAASPGRCQVSITAEARSACPTDTIAAHYPIAAASLAAAGAAQSQPGGIASGQTPRSSAVPALQGRYAGQQQPQQQQASVLDSPLQGAAPSLGRRAGRTEQHAPRSIRSAFNSAPALACSPQKPAALASASPAKAPGPMHQQGLSLAHARTPQRQQPRPKLSPSKLALLQGLSRGFGSMLSPSSAAAAASRRASPQDSARGSGGGLRASLRRPAVSAEHAAGDTLISPRSTYTNSSAAKAPAHGTSAGV